MGTNVDQLIRFVAPATGTYYVRIAGAPVEYSLVVARNADFDTEDNDSIATAQDISETQVVFGHVGYRVRPLRQ